MRGAEEVVQEVSGEGRAEEDEDDVEDGRGEE